ncbi:hypothetical protein PACID_17350 [Acidipropionibacterium acidipropionici ATCC 4875]|uniref:Uncharacterized protein n=1 Tax=Acidipropionibacterium acidipropionici (strain ATCC 4875 / DSM 20272 / JCM 6432 / NBRC 12425 / NCIMB 8070 / 4) TaxID=1171373 RepID=K7SJR6_ACIA4|nr:hypothetical protein PACID_17350 [Acidipropionibacterium acidipropionici ATCC 4875]
MLFPKYLTQSTDRYIHCLLRTVTYFHQIEPRHTVNYS